VGESGEVCTNDPLGRPDSRHGDQRPNNQYTDKTMHAVMRWEWLAGQSRFNERSVDSSINQAKRN